MLSGYLWSIEIQTARLNPVGGLIGRSIKVVVKGYHCIYGNYPLSLICYMTLRWILSSVEITFHAVHCYPF